MQQQQEVVWGHQEESKTLVGQNEGVDGIGLEQPGAGWGRKEVKTRQEAGQTSGTEGGGQGSEPPAVEGTPAVASNETKSIVAVKVRGYLLFVLRGGEDWWG